MIGERILQVRQFSKLNQLDFGSRIGISGASISKLESSKNVPSERTIKLICSEFGVEEKWLRTGEGEMFVKHDPVILEVMRKYGFPDVVEKLLTAYAQLPEDKQQIILEYTQLFISEVVTSRGYPDIAPGQPQPDPQRLEELRDELGIEGDPLQIENALPTKEERIARYAAELDLQEESQGRSSDSMSGDSIITA